MGLQQLSLQEHVWGPWQWIVEGFGVVAVFYCDWNKQELVGNL
jgi:hypothetical protein